MNIQSQLFDIEGVFSVTCDGIGFPKLCLASNEVTQIFNPSSHDILRTFLQYLRGRCVH